MAATAIFSNSITSESIHNSVLSYDGSKIFIQKLIPTSVGLILFHRTDIDRSNFEERNCKGLRFTTFKRMVSHTVLKEICRWSKGALDAFKREYLHELHLMFVDVRNSFNVLESYRFQFRYGSQKETQTKVRRENLKGAVAELFKLISEINVEPLKETQFIPYMCISYNNNVPRDYEPPYFQVDTGDDSLANYLASECRSYIRLGQTNTGFHMINYECNVPGWNPSAEKTVDVLEDISVQEIDSSKQTNVPQCETLGSAVSFHQTEQDVISSSMPTDSKIVLTSMDLSDNEEQIEHDSIIIDDILSVNGTKSQESKESDSSVLDDKLNCVCFLKKKFYNIDLVECSYCRSMQHVPCLGYLYVQDIDNFHVCNKCKNEKSSFSNHLFSSFRLLVAHIFFNNSFAYEVLNEMKDNVKKLIIKMLEAHNAVQYVDNKYIVTNNMDVLIEKIFPQNGKTVTLEDIGVRAKKAKYV